MRIKLFLLIVVGVSTFLEFVLCKSLGVMFKADMKLVFVLTILFSQTIMMINHTLEKDPAFKENPSIIDGTLTRLQKTRLTLASALILPTYIVVMMIVYDKVF